jgi:hypothetical protein
VAGLISQMVTGLLTLAVLIWSYRYTAKVTREIKRADVLMEVNRKFDTLCKDREELAQKETGDSKYYYERFWSLQSQQFHYWLQGLVTDYVFSQWMLNRKHEFVVDAELYGIKFGAGWEYAKQGFRFHSDFVEFIEEIHKGTDVRVAMQKFKPKLQFD